ncbi:resuscitation-promoting factor [Nonomuraea gerenzanensis]|uniref:Cell wall-binding protein n=1 Tax=Nonomuraea gerenzanensis TaxID=93944 RepID=A0A1M4EQA0_9ACTN|nr:resuscitation-promoting factor [Nonomuraea gerenzanensis]UBU12448.1 ubiquitin-like domain-containing protein [Nonomuraea gerenzanensis]SBP01000.1 Cell wall-binding protein [Nonomuraea gerenzanensis]
MCAAGVVAVGALVVVSFLVKEVIVVVDGDRRHVRAFGGTVHEVLADAQVPVGYGDVVRPSGQAEVEDGATIEVRRARPLTLTLDGRTSTHLVTATNVGDALAELDVARTASKISAPPGDRVPLEGMKLTVYTRRKVYVVAGTTRVTWRTTARTVREVLRQKRIALRRGYLVNPPLSSFPKDGTVITVTPPRTVPIQPEVLELDWESLAQCESRGDLEAYNPDGPYYGLYQFSLPMWQAVGGMDTPVTWPEEEQTYRAQLLYQQVGGRWQGQWPHCGDRLFTMDAR